jgi:hypothetical protein
LCYNLDTMNRLEKGSILRVVDVEPRGKVTAVDRRGRKRQLDVKYVEANKPKFPEGTIESLFPIMQRVLVKFPGINSPEPGFWLEIDSGAQFSYEFSVIKLRANEVSSREAADAVVAGVLALAGINTKDIGEQVMGQMKSQVTREIRNIYVATTERRP